ncbi:MAG TPA: CoB--CoM heterodisulfide reductase iron-sulfur subunit A family protein [Dehalococcoidia bacterium]|nr:CoB--CoM heterodisulfide reductase iron-sulfur subunit A family protein [Dehalococcoidia bacterium]
MEEPRIGVYVCHCGTNIAGTIDVEEVAKHAATLPYVVVSRHYEYMCSDPGQELIKNDIKQLGINRVVVASCSPRLHEKAFQGVLRESGLSPYLLQMANIREHCAWLHEPGPESTEKAKRMVRAAVNRVSHHEALEIRQVPIFPATLVIGGGIAGIQAAMEIANSNQIVYLVEREPSIGGHMAQFDKTFPTLDCAACILTPRMTEVARHRYIRILTYSEVIEISGYVGNFRVKIRRKPRYVDEEKCIGCGICQEKCPWKVPSEFDVGMRERKAIYTLFPQAVPNVPVIDTGHCAYFLKGTCRACEKFCDAKAINFEEKELIFELDVGNIIIATGFDTLDATKITQYGYGRYPNVFTSLEFERLCSPTGPTEGQIVLANGKQPDSVAIIHCVGSRDKNYHEYCSRVCCMHALKYAHLLKEKTSADVYQMYIDMRCFGKGYEEFYQRVQKEKVNFIRGKVAKVTDEAIEREENGKLIVLVEDTLLGSMLRVPVDMVVLCVAIEPRKDAQEVAKLFHLGRSEDGFFLERHAKLDPVATMSEGIFIVGCCQGPKDIPDTVAQASAAAARALAMIVRGNMEVSATTAHIDENKCSGCKICNLLCPFNAIFFDDETKVSRINQVLCQGCGVCATACPSGAITHNYFTAEEIMAELEGVLA